MCFSLAERMIALRYLRSRRREGFMSVISVFSVLGIMLGVATLIVVTSLMNGIRQEMTNRFVGLDGHLSVYHQSGKIDLDFQPFLTEVTLLPERLDHDVAITGQVMASANGVSRGAQVMAFARYLSQNRSVKPELDDPARLRDPAKLDSSMTPEVLAALKNDEGVVLGEQLAYSLGVKAGDQVSLISPKGRATIAGVVPSIKSYPVAGTLKTGMHLYDSSLIVMPFFDAQAYFHYKGAADGFGYAERVDILLKDPSKAKEVAAKLSKIIGPEYTVRDWQSNNSSLFEALLVQRNVMVIILTMIVLVAAFNIISSLVMLVQDKSSDIAILRTIGASRATVMWIFCLSGTLLGALGAMLGLGLGLYLAAHLDQIKQLIEQLIGQKILVEEIYFLSSLPTQTDPKEVTVVFVVALAISFLATLYPAWRASRLNPVEALRYE